MFLFILLLPLFLLPVRGAPAVRRGNSSTSSYHLDSLYTSANFFSAFTFFSDPDPTSGHVVYQTRDQAHALSLAGMLPSAAQQPIYLGTEHSSLAPAGRASVRVQSTAAWTHGLFIFDIAHMPTGCGTWPAIWLLGSGAPWPAFGEIDILEGVNDQIGNRMTLHTTSGCSMANSSTQNAFTGTLVTPDCDVNAQHQSGNEGCQIADADPTSFGAPFNEQGGGVYVLEWTSSALSMWFFPRHAKTMPADLSAALALPPTSSESSVSSNSKRSASALDPASWPTPQSRFAGSAGAGTAGVGESSGSTASSGSSGCNLDNHIKNQSIIINTSLCGAWAGAVWNQEGSCGQKASTCEAFVTQNPSAFSDAFWAIRSVQVWQMP